MPISCSLPAMIVLTKTCSSACGTAPGQITYVQGQQARHVWPRTSRAFAACWERLQRRLILLPRIVINRAGQPGQAPLQMYENVLLPASASLSGRQLGSLFAVV